jgi:predicted RND superfamily exporter protein
MRINSKRFLVFFATILMLTFVSCQTKKVINSTKYENLISENKQEVDGYLADAKKMVPKKENEIVLLFQYNCFFGQKIKINNTYTKDFPKSDKVHYGQSIVNFSKNLGKIKIKLSDGKSFSISQKKGYDYITICYNEKSEILYIHYYDYPKMLIEE